jgi:flagellar motility protein MotE (MotC chaperone)
MRDNKEWSCELQNKERRIVHLTFYKCASQWVRDVLTDPEVSESSGYPLSVSGFDVAASGAWPVQPPSTFAGPIYSASYDDWAANAGPQDRALVVVRDPRDLVVSLVFSLGFSHVPSNITQLLRAPILAASDQDRIRIGIYLLTQWADRMRSWGPARTGTREHVVTYHQLVARPNDEFTSICHFLDWDIEPRLLRRVVDRYSFENRTGRRPGELNPYSHLRKGVAGDWRNHFDSTVGEEFESTFPHLLADLGYEQDGGWYKDLPQQMPAIRNETEEASSSGLLSKLASFEDQYMELQLWRSAALDRLDDVNRLTAEVEELQARIAAPNPETEQHLAQIHELTRTVRQLEGTCDRRLAMIEELRQVIQNQNISAEQRLSDVYALTRNVRELEVRVSTPDQIAEERLRDILKLTEHIRNLESTVSETQRAAEDRKRCLEEIRSSSSYRYGFTPLSKLGRLFR